MRMLDLFSGIGGFSLAAEWIGGIETAGFVEKDEWCRKVLAKNWPGVPQHDDIKTYEPGQFGPVDIVTGGFPCQSFSLAGKRRGKDDDRYLWPEMARIIEGERPRYVIGENVPGIINVALDTVLDDLESLGYTTRAVVIPAGAVNALHRRDRLWILGFSDHDGQPADQDAGAARSRITGGSARSISAEQPQGSGGSSGGPAGMAYSHGVSAGGNVSTTLAPEGEDARWTEGYRDGPEDGSPAGQRFPDFASLKKMWADPDYGTPGFDYSRYQGAIVSHSSGEPDRAIRPWLRPEPSRPCGSLANADSRGRGEQGGTDSAPEPLHSPEREEGAPGIGSGSEDVPDSDRPGRGKHGGTEPVQPQHEAAQHGGGREAGGPALWQLDPGAHVVSPGLVRFGGTIPSEVRQGFIDGSWEHGIPRLVPDGIVEVDRRRKVSAAGNAIVPLVAYEIMRALFQGEVGS